MRYMNKYIVWGAAAVSFATFANAYALDTGDLVDTSMCVNCDQYPAEFLEIDESARLDLSSQPPERLLDFLIGEWEIFHPGDERAGFEIYEWFVSEKVIEAFQEWTYFASGEVPWRGRSYYQYVPDEKRWHFNWAPGDNAGALYTGGLESDGLEIAFYEYDFVGDAKSLTLKPSMRYVLKNITQDHFLVEMFRTKDGGKSYPFLRERLYYKRRTN